MTNQLETAKEWLSDLNKIIDKTDNECTKQKRDVLEWLVENVEELEHELEADDRQEEQWKELISTTMHWKSIYEKEAERYKQALEFYADEKTYEPLEQGELTMVFNPIDIDTGEKARQALEREE